MIGSMKEMEKKLAERGRPPLFDAAAHPWMRSPLLPLAGSLLSGVLLALCYPPHGNATLVFVALVPLLYAVQSATARRAAVLGLLSGFVFFVLSLAWLRNLTGAVEGWGMKASAWLGYAVLAAYCALYFVPFAVAAALGVRQWVGGNVRRNLRFMFATTMVWTGAEYLRGTLFTGFPWNPLGNTQYANPTIIQIAAWGGVAVVSAYIVWMNTAIFVTFRQYTHGTRAKKYRPHFELMLGILPVALAVMHGMNTLFNRPPLLQTARVALVQPNIPQTEKWDEEKDRQIRETLGRLSADAIGRAAAEAERKPDLLIWPETALPGFLRASRPDYDLVRNTVAAAQVPLLVGTMDFGLVGERTIYHNSSILIGAGGVEVAKYDKQHLVPFGEYVPFPGMLRKFTPIPVDCAPGRQATLMPLAEGASFSVLICFEDTVAPLAAKAARAGARWLVNQSNDAWFDPSAQSEQHLAHAVFRCIENRIPMVRCCNTGVSCFIDAYGNIGRELEVRTEGVAVGELHPRPVGLASTFYTRHPNLFAQLALLVGATALYILRARERKQQKTGT